MTPQTGPVKLTPEEVQFIKAPLTEAERAATKGMPPHVGRGWVIRSRAGELARRRGEQRSERITAAFEQLAEALHEPGVS